MCYPVFYAEIVYWFGMAVNTIGLFGSVSMLIKGGCIQGLFYKERYVEESDRKYDKYVVELPDRDIPTLQIDNEIQTIPDELRKAGGVMDSNSDNGDKMNEAGTYDVSN